MTTDVKEAIEVLRNLPEEKAKIAAAAVINIAAADDVERDWVPRYTDKVG